jgi:hypothetical protein
VPDPTPNDGFTFHVNEAEKAAKESLPAVADLLRAPARVLTSHEWMGGAGVVEQAAITQRTYGMYIDMLGRRQYQVANVALDTAEALQDVIDLYRRADGQA